MPNSFLDSVASDVKKPAGGNKFLETATPEQHFYTPEVQSAVENVAIPAPIQPSESRSMFQKYQDWSTNTGKGIANFFYGEHKTEDQLNLSNTSTPLPEKTFFTAFKEIKDEPAKVLPFLQGGNEAAHAIELYNAGLRLENDTASARDIALMRDYIKRSQQDTSWGYDVANLVTQSIPFMAELGLTGGVYTAGRKAAEKGAEVVLKKFLTEEGQKLLEKRAVKFALKATAVTAGATAQTVPSMFMNIGASTVEKMTPIYNFTEDEQGKVKTVIEKPGQDFGEALRKSMGESWVETVSERTGGVLSGVGSKVKDTAFKSAFVKAFFNSNTGPVGKKLKALDVFLSRIGWNGVAGEMFEERIGDVMHGALNEAGLSDQEWKLPTAEQLSVELVGFAVPGTAFAGVAGLLNKGKQMKWEKDTEKVITESGLAEDVNKALKVFPEADVEKAITENTGVTSDHAKAIIDIARGVKPTQESEILNADDVAAEVEAIAKAVEKEAAYQSTSTEELAQRMDSLEREISEASSEEKKQLEEEMKTVRNEIARRTDDLAKQITEKEQQITTKKPAKETEKGLPYKGPKVEEKSQITVTPKNGGESARVEIIGQRQDGIIAKGQSGTPMLYTHERFDVAPIEKTAEEKQIEQEVAQVAKESTAQTPQEWAAGAENVNPSLFKKATKAKTVDEFIDAVVKADKTTRENVSIENLTEWFDKVKKASPTEKKVQEEGKDEKKEKPSTKGKEGAKMVFPARFENENETDGETNQYAPVRKDFYKGMKKYLTSVREEMGYEPDTDKKGKDVSVTYNPGGTIDAGEVRAIFWKPGTNIGIYVKVQGNWGDDETEVVVGDRYGMGTLVRATLKSNKYSGLGNRYVNMDGLSAEDFAKRLSEIVDVEERNLLSNNKQDESKKSSDITGKRSESGKGVAQKDEAVVPGQKRGGATDDDRGGYQADRGIVDTEVTGGIIEDNGQPTNRRPDIRSDRPDSVSDTGDVSAESDSAAGESAHGLGAGELADRVDELGDGLSAERTDVIEEKIGKKGRQSINEQVKALLEERNFSTNREDYTEDEIGLFKLYSGAGGKESAGAEGKGLLSEFYTPNKVVQKVWELALKHAGTVETAYEPSAGTGRFIMLRPDGVAMDGIEMDRVSGTVAQIVNSESTIEIGDFQNKFFKQDGWPQYDLVIGNPPYGARGGFIKGKGEEPKIDRWEEYFIKRGLDMTKEGGIVAYVVNSSFLQKGNSKGKEAISRLGTLVAAYRLPEGTFEDTTIGTDIIIVRKNTKPTYKNEYNDNEMFDFVNDNYFISHSENILGETKTRTNRFGKEETYVTGDLSALDGIQVEAGTPTVVQTVKEDPKPAKTRVKKATKKTDKKAGVKKPGKTQHVYEPITKGVKVSKRVISAKGREYTPKELKQWANTQRDGSINGFIDEEQKQILNFSGGKWFSDTLYYSGNISQRLEQLERDKVQMSADQYERQKGNLLAIKPKELEISDISFDPQDRHILNLKVGNSTILRGFLAYLRDADIALPGGVYWSDITRLVSGQNARKDTKQLQPQIKDSAKQLFNLYVKEILPADVQERITTNYNEMKNSVVNARYADIPVVIDGMSNTFKGKPFELSATQKRGVSFLVQKGSGLIAYGVGVGKTLTMASATVANMQAGKAKRPIMVVPKSTIDQTWIDTFRQAFPGVGLVNLQGMTADVVRRMKAERGEPKDWVKDGEIAVISHEGLMRFGFTEEELRTLTGDLQDALWQEAKQTKRAKEAKEDKIDEIAGQAMRFATEINFSDLGFDHVSVDEIHNHRKVFQGAKTEKDEDGKEGGKKRFSNVVGGTPAKRAVHLFMVTQYIQKKTGGNVFLASATPFENHATEMYNILSFVARDRMKEMGIFNINDFFANFADFVPEQDLDLTGRSVWREKMKTFKNLPVLQSLLREFVDRREDPTLVRPERRVFTPILSMSAMQEENLDKIQRMLAGEDVSPEADAAFGGTSEGMVVSSNSDREEGAFLKASTYSIANSVSPYFIKEWAPKTFTNEELVENSPKIEYAMELVKKLHSDEKTKNYGTFIYFGTHGVDHHEKVREYIVEHLGFEDSEVAVLNGQTDEDERDRIKEAFNAGDVKVLIGGDPTKEGIDLQNNGYATINLALGWNPTEPAQVEGRVWRQGNKRSIAPLVYPLVENSGDVMIYGKFEEKGGRINDLFSYQGEVFDVGELDPREKKIALLTDPKAKATMEIEYDRSKLDAERVGVLTEQKNLTNMKEELAQSEREAERYDTWIKEEEDPKSERAKGWKKERDSARAKVKRIQESFAKKNITNVDPAIETLALRVEAIEEQMRTLSDTYKERLDRFTKERMEEVRNRKSIADHIEDFTSKTEDLVEYTKEQIEQMQADKKAEIEASGVSPDFMRRDNLGRFATEERAEMADQLMRESFTISTNQIKLGEDFQNAMGDVSAGQKSMTDLPILVNKEGDFYYVIDGNHRLAQDMLNGATQVRVVANEKVYTELTSPAYFKTRDEMEEWMEIKKNGPLIGPDETRAILKPYFERLKIEADLEFVDVMLTGDKIPAVFSLKKEEVPEKAWAVTVSGKMVFTKKTSRVSPIHELGHTILNNLDKMPEFGVTKAELNAIADDETIMAGLETYWKSRQTGNFGSKMVTFFEMVVMKIKQLLKMDVKDAELLQNFYNDIYYIRRFGPTVRQRPQNLKPYTYVRNNELTLDFEGFRTTAEPGYKRKTVPEDLVSEADPLKINLIRKDINLLNDITAQARDIYLKDKKEFKGADIFQTVADTRRIKKGAIDRRFADMLAPYFALGKDEKATLNIALTEGDRQTRKWNKSELATFGVTSAPAIGAYYKTREAFEYAHDMLLAKMEENGVKEEEIDQFRAVRVGYIPHRWEGRYVVKTQTMDENGAWKTQSMQDYKTEGKALRAHKELESNENTRYVLDTLDSVDVDFFTAQHLTTENVISAINRSKVSEEFRQEVVQGIRDLSKEKGFGRYYIRRTNIEGYETENLDKVFADYFSGLAGYVTKMEAAPMYFKALQTIDPRRQKKFYAWLRDSIAYDMGNTEELNTVKQTAFIWMLANDISYLIVNATQNMTVGTGELSKYMKGAKKIAGAETALMGAMASWWTGRISAEERGAIEFLLKNGRLGGEMTSELMGFKSNPIYRTMSNTLTKALYSSTAFVESHINRVPAFIAARRTLLANGADPATVDKKALEISDDIHFRYGKQNRPWLYRGRKNVIFVFTHWTRSFLYQLSRDLSQREFMALGKKMFYTAVLGGALSLPFAKMWLAIYKEIVGDDDEDLKKELSTWELALTKGFPAVFGADLSGRVSIDIFQFGSILSDPTNIVKWGGAGASMIDRFSRGYDLAMQERYFESAAKLIPDGLGGNFFKAYSGYTYGVRSQAGRLLERSPGVPMKYTPWEASLRGMGFTPTQENLAWERRGKFLDQQAKKSADSAIVRRKIETRILSGDITGARALEAKAIEEGTLGENSTPVEDYIEKPALMKYTGRAHTGETLSLMKKEFIAEVYQDEKLTPQKKAIIDKKFDSYATFGPDNELVTALLGGKTNEDRTKVLLQARQDMGAEAFAVFFGKAKRTKLISDDLSKLYRRAQAKVLSQ